ncbi:MAG: hypothetical protein ACJAVV_003164 [Alphaproteobacteria bacterium]
MILAGLITSTLYVIATNHSINEVNSMKKLTILQRSITGCGFNRLHIMRTILLGLVLFFLVACVGSPKLPEASTLIAGAQVFDEKTAQEAWRVSQVVKYSEIWTRQSAPYGDPYRAGQAAYYMALATLEPEWSKAAINVFNKALDGESDFPHRARAGLGAAHRLAARDFPIKDAAQYLLLGIPGWKRTHHIQTSFSHLNRAVEAAPHDPVIRLSRVAAFVGIPTFFGSREKGLADYAQLDKWTKQPSSNSAYSTLLSSKGWRDEYSLMRAQSMKQAGNEDEATMAWQVLSTDANDTYLKSLATHSLAN